ncbi:hypothetical protein B0O80DRAFT_286068 [Mortierella sp. GBAus27b]|nr:hypothetical protein B0O80DRAFT_286068 [Mortierella sp. GBAus27b]
MKIKTTAAIALICLAAHSEAINFGRLLRTVKSTASGIDTILGGILGVYKNDPVVCAEQRFKSKVVATNAWCQLFEDFDAMEACQNFGADCVSVPGRWGCGSIETEHGNERGCLFQPRRLPNGAKIPKIKFDFDDDDLSMQYNDGQQCVYGRQKPMTSNAFLDGPSAFLEDDEIPVDYKDMSNFFAKTTIADLARYEQTYNDNEDPGKDKESVTATAVKALDLAGIRYPIGKTGCTPCKNLCEKLFSGDQVAICKYSACVRFLGGYMGAEQEPSCDVIDRP